MGKVMKSGIHNTRELHLKLPPREISVLQEILIRSLIALRLDTFVAPEPSLLTM